MAQTLLCLIYSWNTSPLPFKLPISLGCPSLSPPFLLEFLKMLYFVGSTLGLPHLSDFSHSTPHNSDLPPRLHLGIFSYFSIVSTSPGWHCFPSRTDNSIQGISSSICSNSSSHGTGTFAFARHWVNYFRGIVLFNPHDISITWLSLLAPYHK